MQLARAAALSLVLVLAAACDDSRPIDDTAQTAECSRCHGYPPPPFVAGATSHPANSDCSLCHPDTVQADDFTLVPGGAHLNGLVERTGGHAPGYVDPAVHGPDALAFFAGTGPLECTDCHGADFDGGSAQRSCNACHGSVGFADWRTNCTFCHGTQTQTWTSDQLALAAPPESVAGATAATDPGVGAHERHLAGGSYSDGFACATCHAVPADLAHVDGAVTVDLAGAGQRSLQASLGTYTPAGQTCATYCHGATITTPPPTAQWTTPGPLACDACHASRPSTGSHTSSFHATTTGGAPTPCAFCHEGYVQGTSVDLSIHVDGAKTVVYPNRGGGTTILTDPGWTCSICHTGDASGNQNAPILNL